LLLEVVAATAWLGALCRVEVSRHALDHPACIRTARRSASGVVTGGW
jgi:hypothetical protein